MSLKHPLDIDLQTDQSVDRIRAAVRTIPDFPTPGIQFKDITPILKDARLLADAIDALAAPFVDFGITKVAAIEARGFILGTSLAHRLEAGFIPIRKKGKLPYETHVAEYELEYGTDSVEMHVDAVDESDLVLIHDDVIATGGTASATGRLIRDARARVVGFSFLVELSYLSGREALDGDAAIHSVLTF